MNTLEPSVCFRRWRKLNIPVEKLLSFDYVRETPMTVGNPAMEIGKRKRPLFGCQHGQIIGYTTVGKTTWPRSYNCLVWWHKYYDRDIQPEGPYQLPPERRNDPEWKHYGPGEAIPPEWVLKFFPEFLVGC